MENASPRSPRSDHGDAAAEYRAAREDAAVFDLSDRTLLELTGRDPAKFLHAYCTNDVVALPDGGGCEAFVTSLKGRILGHVWIAIDGEGVRIDSGPGAAETLIPHLARYALLADVEIADRTAEFAKYLVTGRRATERLGLTDLSPYGFRRMERFGGEVAVQRTDLLGDPGCLLTIPLDGATRVRDALTAAGVSPAGRIAYEALRIEAGLPRHGVDVGDEHLAQEAARTSQAISFTKGCYLGQETVHRLHVMGHTNRELRTLHLEGDVLPAVGTPVLDDEKEVGVLTSVAGVPGANRVVALAVVRKASAAEGHVVSVDGRTARVSRGG